MANNTILLLLNLALAIVPMVFSTLTSFMKISIVLNLLKQALAVQNVPSNMMIFILALVISYELMQPVASQIEHNIKTNPWTQQGEIQIQPAELLVYLDLVCQPLKLFLEKNSDSEISNRFFKSTTLSSTEQLTWRQLIFTFTLSEFKEGLLLGLIMIIPFILIDFLVANLLIAIGLGMLSPVIISLPVKISLLIYSDFLWLQIELLMQSYS